MLSLWGILLLILSITTTGLAQEFKIGVINSEIIVENYSEFRQAEAQLGREVESMQSQRAAWEADMERLQKHVGGLENQLASGQNIFTTERKASLQMEIDSLKMDFSIRMNQQSVEEQEKFNRRRAELLAGVFEVVNKAIEEIGERDGYDFIIDSANGTVVYAKDPDDLTDELLQHLNSR